MVSILSRPHNRQMALMTIGDWLKREREARRLSQAGLERQAAISDKYVSRIENNKAFPTDDVRERIHNVFGTTDEDLFKEGILTKLMGFDGSPIYKKSIAPPGTAVEQLQAWLKSGEIDEAEAEQIVEWRRERRTWKEELGDE